MSCGAGPSRGTSICCDDHAIALAQPQRRLARAVVDAHVPGIDRPPQRGPAERGQLLGEKHIQPLARLLGRDDEFAAARMMGSEVRGRRSVATRPVSVAARLLGGLFVRRGWRRGCVCCGRTGRLVAGCARLPALCRRQSCRRRRLSSVVVAVARFVRSSRSSCELLQQLVERLRRRLSRRRPWCAPLSGAAGQRQVAGRELGPLARRAGAHRRLRPRRLAVASQAYVSLASGFASRSACALAYSA